MFLGAVRDRANIRHPTEQMNAISLTQELLSHDSPIKEKEKQETSASFWKCSV